MLVSVPLHLDTLQGKPTGADLQAVLEARYRGCDLCPRHCPADRRQAGAGGAERHQPAGTVRVNANEKHRQAVLVARLDNLGKGASGAAVQNIAPDAGPARQRGAPGEGRCLSRSVGLGPDLHAGRRHPEGRTGRLHRPHRRGDRRRRDRLRDRHLVPLPGARRPATSSASARAPTSRTARSSTSIPAGWPPTSATM